MSDVAVWDETPDGRLGCRSCPAKWRMPARYMATPKRSDGAASPTDWPLCTEHMQHAMVAGWFPINEIAAQGTEARRATTPQSGVVHDGPVPAGNAPKVQP